jgi:hypothetical protein
LDEAAVGGDDRELSWTEFGRLKPRVEMRELRDRER